jgi:hypothetical protein
MKVNWSTKQGYEPAQNLFIATAGRRLVCLFRWTFWRLGASKAESGNFEIVETKSGAARARNCAIAENHKQKTKIRKQIMLTQPLDAPPGGDDKPKSFNVGDAHAQSAEEKHFAFLDAVGDMAQYFCGGDNRFSFHKKGEAESGEKVFVDNHFRAYGAGGDYRQVALDFCELVTAKDIEGKQYIARKRKILKSPDGDPIFPSAQMSLWKFCETFEPDWNWITKSEWAAIVESCAPVLEADKRAELGDAAHRKVAQEQWQQAADAKLNPHGTLAAGIAAGVAQALAELGVSPKKTAKP